MTKKFRKSDIDERIKQLKDDYVVSEEDLNELIDTDGSLIDARDNYVATDRIVKSKKTSDDFARATSQGPGAYYPWGGAYYGGYYTMSENEEIELEESFGENTGIRLFGKTFMSVRDIKDFITSLSDKQIMSWQPPKRKSLSKWEYILLNKKRDLQKRLKSKDEEGSDYEDEAWSNPENVKEEIDEIAKTRMESLVDEVLYKSRLDRDFVKRRKDEADLMHDVEIEPLSAMKEVYEKPLVARKATHLIDLVNKEALSGKELAIILKYIVDNVDINKISGEERELIGDLIKYGEQGEQ